jgi:hypothetical protein
MCDYSLYLFPNRLSREGEELIAYRFSSGCIGFVSVVGISERENRRTWLATNWPQLNPWFFPRQHDGPVAVCIPPGTEMRLAHLDLRLCERLGLQETEDATFIQVSAEAFVHRDGLQFRNGKRILLQDLPTGQRVFVCSSTASQSRSRYQDTPEEAHA